MSPILPFLDTIQALPDDKFILSDGGHAFFESYLQPYGFSLARITSHTELLTVLSYCNSQDFERLVQTPAPANRLQLLWRALRNLGNGAH